MIKRSKTKCILSSFISFERLHKISKSCGYHWACTSAPTRKSKFDFEVFINPVLNHMVLFKIPKP